MSSATIVISPPSGATPSVGSLVNLTWDDKSPGGANYAWFDTYGGGTITNAQAYSTANSLRCDVTSGQTDLSFLAGRPSHNLGENDEIWVRFRTYFPAGYDFTASPHFKFFRIDQGPGSGVSKGHGAHIDWYISGGGPSGVGSFDFIQEDVQSWLYGGGGGGPSTGIVRGQWQTWNFYYKLHSVASSGRIRLWRDNTLVVDTNARATLGLSTNVIGSTADANAQGLMLMTYWNGGAPATQSFYVDDFAVSDNISGAPTNTDSYGNLWIGV